MALEEGRWLDGKYVIVRRLAEGGTSTVYLGVNERIGKDVAVKVLRAASVVRDPGMRQRFEREARVMSRIRSEHVADVYDFGELPSGEPFMVMEYLEGESLARILERERTVSSDRLAVIAAQILDALSAAHRAGVIHRDLKPENVIVMTRGKDVLVKVVDFGISMVLDPSGDHALRLTSSGSVLGTPLYMSPEQARGQTDQIDHRTDLYSLGVMLYEATAGEPPLTGSNVNELLFRVALDDPPPLATRVPSVDPMLASIVARAMEKLPADRYASADEMLTEIDRWRVRRSLDTTPPLALELPPRSAGARSPLSRGGAFVIAGAALAGVLLLAAPIASRRPSLGAEVPQPPPMSTERPAAPMSTERPPLAPPAAAPTAPPAEEALRDRSTPRLEPARVPPSSLAPASATPPRPAPSGTPLSAGQKAPNRTTPPEDCDAVGTTCTAPVVFAARGERK